MQPFDREFSIWNALVHGKPRQPGAPPASRAGPAAFPCSGIGKKPSNKDDEKTSNFGGEKAPQVPPYDGKYHRQPLVARSRAFWAIRALAVVSVVLLVVTGRCDFFATSLVSHEFAELNQQFNHRLLDFLDGAAGVLSGGNAAPKQVILVSNPFVVPDHAPVFQALVVNHTFGNSWGRPAVVKLAPPPSNVTFNQVILTLNTTVAGVQYDRLVNIFVDDIQVWRSSTAEPAGGEVFSTFDKDVSTFLKLFQSESTVIVQLDNLITPRLTGEFYVELYATYFFDGAKVGPSGIDAINFSSGPASKLHSLTKHSLGRHSSEHPPISYLPSDRISVQLPTVLHNTTVLGLSVFTSGNAAEEFWYSNVLNKFTHLFDKAGRTLLGHGPIRVLNVYFNGEKIALQSPEPVIFTGGISPALWSPVVSVSAFDIKSIDFDLTPLLPFLWESQAIEDRLIEIEISNGFDEKIPGSQDGIAENWITSAFLQTHELADVVASAGSVVNITDTKDLVSISFGIPYTGTINQIITSKFEASVESNLQFTLADGSVVNTSVILTASSSISNVQKYTGFGSQQSLVHVGGSKSTVQYKDNSPDEHQLHPALKKVEKSFSYPVVIQLLDESVGDDDIRYNVSLAITNSKKVSFNDAEVWSESTGQNGTSVYVLSSTGNHGFGSLKTKYEQSSDAVDYKRKVIAVNGTIVSDVVGEPEIDLTDIHDEVSKEEIITESAEDEATEKYKKTIKTFLHGCDKRFGLMLGQLSEVADMTFISSFNEVMDGEFDNVGRIELN